MFSLPKYVILFQLFSILVVGYLPSTRRFGLFSHFQLPSALKEVKTERLPWDRSINATRDLVYADVFNAQLQKIHELGMEEVVMDEKFASRVSETKPGRVFNLCFRNDYFRSVRLTYFDAGHALQVYCFNTYSMKLIFLCILGFQLRLVSILRL